MSHKQYWEMNQFTGKNKSTEIFKCTNCNATTRHPEGHNGEPNRHECTPQCQASHGDWKVGDAKNLYKENFEKIFPNSPGAGI